MKLERIAWLAVLVLVALFLAKTLTTSACLPCWSDPDAISSGAAGKSRVLALFDQQKAYLHVFWYDAADTAIYHYANRPDSGGYYCPVEKVAHTAIGTFGAAVDSTGHLHFVWGAPSEIGPYGETSNLFYMKTQECILGTKSVENITPAYNVPGDEDTLSEDFEGGELPEGWGSVGSDGPWGQWSVEPNLGEDSSYAAVGARLDPFLTMGKFYLVMPPFLIDDGDSAEFAFSYRIDRPDAVGSAGLRLRGFEGFPMRTFRHFADPKPELASRQFVLWEDTLITNTTFEGVRVAFPNSLEGRFLHVAFELFAVSDTTVRVCIDNLCTGLADSLKPEVPTSPAYCFEPVVAVDCDDNIHVAFTRIAWQPNACICRDQVYYSRYDAVTAAWCAPFHVDSSGVDCKGCDPAIAVDRDKNVHVAWTDEGRMLTKDGSDDVFYISRPGDAATPSWNGLSFEVLSDDGFYQGAPDRGACLQPDLAVDSLGDLIAVFHGSRGGDRPDSLRGVPPTFMRILMRKKASGGSWDICTAVPDSLHITDSTYYNTDSLDCRCPRMGVDLDGDMYVAYTWNQTQGGSARGDPEALALAQYSAVDGAWRPSASIMTDLRDTASVYRWPAIRFASDGDGYLFWCQGDTGGTYSTLMTRASNARWESCSEQPPAVVMTVDDFTRGLCPSDDDSLDADEKSIFEILLTVKDGEGIPLPGFPPDSLYVTVAGDTAGPPDTCFTLNDADFGRADSTYRFWCESDDTLFATDTTGVEGTWIRVKNVSGKARLRLQAHYGASAVGSEDTVWINSVDQGPSVPDGRVTAPDFSSFSSAYNRWRLDSLESWVWDVLHQSGDTCSAGGEVIPIFDVDGGDFSWFNYHYQDSLGTGDCDD